LLLKVLHKQVQIGVHPIDQGGAGARVISGLWLELAWVRVAAARSVAAVKANGSYCPPSNNEESFEFLIHEESNVGRG